MTSFAEVLAPPIVVRIERAGSNFEPPPWEYARDDGTFGGRYDDPSGRAGTTSSERFRVVYCSSNSAGSFAETLGRAPFRPSLQLLAELQDTDESLIAASVEAPTLSNLADVLAPLAVELELDDVNLSAILGSNRPFTQACAQLVYQEGFAGIRYLSCYGEGDWECWAFFTDRVEFNLHSPTGILPDDPGLVEVARIFRLTIEGPRGHYIRP